jgi:hypothetical protein
VPPRAHELNSVIARGMAKDPSDRYQRAGELLHEASTAMADLPANQRRAVPAFVAVGANSEDGNPPPNDPMQGAEPVDRGATPVTAESIGLHEPERSNPPRHPETSIGHEFAGPDEPTPVQPPPAASGGRDRVDVISAQAPSASNGTEIVSAGERHRRRLAADLTTADRRRDPTPAEPTLQPARWRSRRALIATAAGPLVSPGVAQPSTVLPRRVPFGNFAALVLLTATLTVGLAFLVAAAGPQRSQVSARAATPRLTVTARTKPDGPVLSQTMPPLATPSQLGLVTGTRPRPAPPQAPTHHHARRNPSRL